MHALIGFKMSLHLRKIVRKIRTCNFRIVNYVSDLSLLPTLGLILFGNDRVQIVTTGVAAMENTADENIRVLVVDDDSDMLYSTSRIVESAGFEVTPAESGDNAIALSTTYRPDLILLNVMMPGLDGYTVCQRIKSNPEMVNTFVLMVTGKKVSDDDRARGLLAGADGYLTRPTARKEFLALLHSLIRIQQTQKQIHKSEEWQQTSLNSMGDGVIATDERGIILFLNPRAESITGWSLNGAKGRPCHEVFRIRNDRSGEPMLNPVEHVLDLGVVIGITNHTILFRKDGSTRYIADSAAPIRDSENKITGVVLVFQDVTSDREKELSLEIAHREWEDMFQAIGHPTIILDANHEIIRANRAALDLVQIPMESLASKRCYHFFHNTQNPPVGCPMENMKTTGNFEKQDMEMEALGRTFLVSCTPVFDTEQQLKHVIHIATDITQRKIAEDQIKKDLAERNLMLREIHHRVKNNLQVIISLINLQLHYVDEPRAKEILSEIKNRIYSMSVVHERLYRSQNFSEIHIQEYLEFIVTELRKSFGHLANIELRFDIDDICLGIEKAIPFGLIVNELVTNTFKHAFPGNQAGEIKIRLKKQPDDQIILMVRDTGIGIPDSFDIVNPKTMGMKIVTILSQQLHGSLSVENKKGASFTLRFA